LVVSAVHAELDDLDMGRSALCVAGVLIEFALLGAPAGGAVVITDQWHLNSFFMLFQTSPLRGRHGPTAVCRRI
jgi:hypothetical protein